LTYSALLSREGVTSQYLAVIKPRRIVSTWTVVSGTKYTSSFDYGQIVSLETDGASVTEASTSALSDGDWYFDTDTDVLTVDFGVNPSTLTVVVTYEMYFGTYDAHFYRIPTDNTARQVYFEPMISQSPRIVSSASDLLFGFMPTFSGQLVLSNATHLFEKHVYDSSFNGALVDLYHYLDTLEVANVSLALRGICGDLSFTNDSLTIEILDRNQIFNEEFRNNAGGADFFTTAVFPSLDPSFINRPVRKVFGVVDGFVPVNIDHDSDAPSTTNNRTWVCISDETNLGSVVASVSASPSSTTTRTYVASSDGLRVGDSVFLDKASGTDGYATITAVNKTGSHYIEHAAIASALVSGDSVRRSFIGAVTVFVSGQAYDLQFGRDFGEYTDATNKVAGFTLGDNFEANHAGMPSPLKPTDMVYARVYGNKNTTTMGGPAFGANSADTGNVSQGVVVLYSVLKDFLGLAESDLDSTTFTALQLVAAEQVGFAVPSSSNEDFPTYKDLIEKICVSVLLKIYQNSSNKWEISQLAPVGSADYTIEDDEILYNTFTYNFSYKDVISTAIANYSGREVNSKHAKDYQYFTSSSSSETAEYLHKIKKQKSFNTFLFLDADASDVASRIRYALGDRRGTCRVSTKNRFFNAKLSDVIDVSRTRMPGFDYDSDTANTRSFAVQSTEKSLLEISIELDDQKGIEDNSGSW